MVPMNKWMACAGGVVLGCASMQVVVGQQEREGDRPMDLGNFSVSLNVKDLAKSREFYEKLGFARVAGDGTHYVIMQNPTATIGLFQGIIPANGLTFNPGWDRTCATLKEFTDVRELQAAFRARGVAFVTEADEASTGPASFTVADPDGNAILFDQHVPRPHRE